MEKIFVEGENLLLRPLSVTELLNINNDRKIKTPIETEAIFDFVKIAITKKIEKMKKVSEDIHDWYTYWLIINKDNGEGIGFIGFKGIPNENGYTEVGYSISSNCRRKGFMTEALSLLMDWAYKYPFCKGITANKVLKTNTGSNKVLNNCNFTLVGSSNEFNNYIIEFKK
ncbi:GNAT family N-acetyltransferase [Clostridium saccharoperbutylacetonicum]|uniref:GNAT family N-acetyltransferase n=1 Tax=Clostridium saccharoperbutylacetonicum TaxID=36745 RepID=UPI000983AABF|nr:GNAT family N-acetyltransferase [Clostridium saccharoperbutylacetonicum]AQR96639.1 hypothetical protein CLSAP_39630 [Clostridium saccharoperbutylacetonicum]NSB32515.1 RimJ/RimL family protein N-acetyltransferase [Clostridium saccharoperbutylacetonicum]